MWGGIPNHFRQVALPGVHIKRRYAGLKNYMALKSLRARHTNVERLAARFAARLIAYSTA